MVCRKCGTSLPNGAKYCLECGAKVESAPADATGIHTVQFRCKGCGSVLQIDPDDPILRCPTCGSSELIAEDKEVVVERLRSKARREENRLYHDEEMGRQQLQRRELEQREAREQQREERERVNSYKHGISPWLTGICILACILAGGFVFLFEARWTAALCLLQVVLLLLSLLLGLGILRTSRREWHVVLLVVALAMIPIVLFSFLHEMISDPAPEESLQQQAERGEPIPWEQIELASVLPTLEAENGYVSDNDAKELSLDTYGFTQEKFSAYVDLCRQRGFTNVIQEDTDSDSFHAYNGNDYELELSYMRSINNRLYVHLIAPEELGVLHWPREKLSALLPAPASAVGVLTEDGQELHACVDDLSEAQFAAYIEACAAAGFSRETRERQDYYAAFDAQWNELTLSYNSYTQRMTMDLAAPEDFPPLRWPGVGLATRIPRPDARVGAVQMENEHEFHVVLGGMTPEDFDPYVDACLEAGFDVEYSRQSHYFTGKDSSDHKLIVQYRGGCITITIMKVVDST